MVVDKTFEKRNVVFYNHYFSGIEIASRLSSLQQK